MLSQCATQSLNIPAQTRNLQRCTLVTCSCSAALHLQVLGNQKAARGLGIPVGAFLTPCPQQELHLPRSPHQPACCSGCHAMLNKFCRTDPRTGSWWCAFCGEETQYHRSLLDAQVSRLQKLGLHRNTIGPGCRAQPLASCLTRLWSSYSPVSHSHLNAVCPSYG